LAAGGLGLGALALGGCAGGTGGVPAGEGWRRFAGTTINFVSENTAPTAAIAANLRPFTELTGIDVRIATYDITSCMQVASLDFASGAAEYHVVYADPWMMLAPLARGMADLREFLEDDSYPQPEGGLADFVPAMLEVEGRFASKGPLYTLPYDCPTLLLHYRKDLFDKYGERIADELGFDPTPGGSLTWEQYGKVGKWFNDNVDEVDYGIGLMAKQHDSLSCDYGNLLWAYGGDYFAAGQRIGLLGATDPGECTLDSPEAVAAAEMYMRLVRVAHPGSPGWDWDSSGAALRSGRIAMCANWHENAAANEQAMPGKIGYATLPRGPARSGNMFGGTGIGVNNDARGAQRGAAWLFVNWATSPAVQLANLASPVGGGTPTRQSVYRKPQVVAAEHRPSKMPNMLASQAAHQAWRPGYLGSRPKIPMWNEVLVTVYTGLSYMVAGDRTPSAAMRRIAHDVRQIVARGWHA